MAPRKKKPPAPICMFCNAANEESAVIITAGPGMDGICNVCIVRFHEKLCEMRYLDMINTKHMTKH